MNTVDLSDPSSNSLHAEAVEYGDKARGSHYAAWAHLYLRSIHTKCHTREEPSYTAWIWIRNELVWLLVFC